MRNIFLKRQEGFSLIELFITLAVGLGLLAGVLSVFVSMKVTTKETATYGELQENGRFALSVLSDDLLRQDFWGDYVGTFDRANLNGTAPGAPARECKGEGLNNGTFPIANGHFRTLWGETATTANPMGCFLASNPAKTGSDILQLKRVVSSPVLPTALSANNYYLITNIGDGDIFLGGGAVPNVDNSQIWEYQHHVYYVTEQKQGSISVPVLMQGWLTNSMTFAPIIDGIEMIRFMYGVDTDDDGIVNTFLSASNMTQALWNNASNSRILAVKVFVLARSVLPDNDYKHEKDYLLGDFSYKPRDNYRRLLFSSTVTLFNARVDSWGR